jgi:anaerobic magnesium-protoporphyrin IX monomethyl ester cyclase
MEISRALENIRQLVAMARHPVHLDLLIGLPGEDAARCRDSLDRVFRLHADHLQLGTLKLLPGTPLREQAERLGYRWDRQPPYEVLSHPHLSFAELAHFKLYAVLLDRLWNTAYLAGSLSWLVSVHFGDRLSACLDALLEASGEVIARQNLQPDNLFAHFTRFARPWLETERVLAELILWDYSQFSLPNNKTPGWIAERLHQQITLSVAGTRRRLPVHTPSHAALQIINQRRATPLPPGQYAIWPRQHKKGSPVEIIPLPPSAPSGRAR